MSQFLVAPSILSADFSQLANEIGAVKKAGADWIHVDVMDGIFVPNITIGPPVVDSLKKVSSLPLDVHLMIDRPERYVKDFIKAGASYLTIHVEATETVAETLSEIRSMGCKPGITLRPVTPIEALEPYLKQVDLVLVMTVNPGFSGQKFMEDQTAKIKWLHEYRVKNKLNYLIEVDGGINGETAKQCKFADVLVAGNFVFKNDYQRSITELKQIKN